MYHFGLQYRLDFHCYDSDFHYNFRTTNFSAIAMDPIQLNQRFGLDIPLCVRPQTV